MLLKFMKNLFFGAPDNSQLEAAMAQKPLLIDVRSPGEFAGGSVAGAVNIPLQTLPHQLKKIQKKKNIVVFCRSGSRSGMAKDILERNGYAKVINGGTWQNVNQFYIS